MTSKQTEQYNNMRAIGFDSKQSKLLCKGLNFEPITGSLSEQQFVNNRMVLQSAIEYFNCRCELIGYVNVNDYVQYKKSIKDTEVKLSDRLNSQSYFVIKVNNKNIHFMNIVYHQQENEYRLSDSTDFIHETFKDVLK